MCEYVCLSMAITSDYTRYVYIYFVAYPVHHPDITYINCLPIRWTLTILISFIIRLNDQLDNYVSKYAVYDKFKKSNMHMTTEAVYSHSNACEECSLSSIAMATTRLASVDSVMVSSRQLSECGNLPFLSQHPGSTRITTESANRNRQHCRSHCAYMLLWSTESRRLMWSPESRRLCAVHTICNIDLSQLLIVIFILYKPQRAFYK